MSQSIELSERELEVLRLVATGASNKEIAQDLSISQNTVKVHIRNIFSKTGVASRTEAAIFAVQTGLVDPAGDQISEAGESENIKTGPLAWATWPLWQKIALAGGVLLLIVLVIAVGAVIYQNAASDVQSDPTPDLAASEIERWQEKAPLNLPRTGLALAAYENQIFAIAGEGSDGIVGLTERYDSDTNDWTTLSSKPTAVRDVMGIVIGGQIFIPGGLLSDNSVSNRLEIFNPTQNQWDLGAPLPKGVSAYAAVAFEGKLYLFGGWDGDEYTSTGFRYDPSVDEWQVLTPMPTARGFSGVAESGGRLFVIGGTDGETALAVNDEYTPEAEDLGSNPWRDAAPLPDGRYGMGLASLAGIIHLVGGESTSGETLPLKYFPPDDRWETFEPFGPSDWVGLGLVPIETNIHAIGGTVGDDQSGQHFTYEAIYTISFPIFR